MIVGDTTGISEFQSSSTRLHCLLCILQLLIMIGFRFWLLADLLLANAQSTIRQFEYMSIKRRVERGINNFDNNCELLLDDFETAIAAGKDPDEGSAGDKVNSRSSQSGL